jgi:hypothetical protein
VPSAAATLEVLTDGGGGGQVEGSGCGFVGRESEAGTGASVLLASAAAARANGGEDRGGRRGDGEDAPSGEGSRSGSRGTWDGEAG